MSTTIGIIEESVWQQIRDGIYHAGGKDEEALVEKVASAWPASADRLLKEFHENRNQCRGAVDIITSKVLETCDRMGKLSDDEARRFALCCFDINPKEYRTRSVSSTLYSLRGRVSGVLAQMAGLADKVDDDLVKLQKRVFAEAECSDFYGPPYDLLDDLVRSKIRMIEHKEKKL